MNSIDGATRLLFEDFLAHLRRLGFHVGLDHHVRLQALLPHLCGACRPDQLKSLLCPLFATSAKQQEVFYSAFETFFPLLSTSDHSRPSHESTLIPPQSQERPHGGAS